MFVNWHFIRFISKVILKGEKGKGKRKKKKKERTYQISSK